MECRWCGSARLLKNGKKKGVQRYRCVGCGHYMSDKAPRFSPEVKARAVDMYLNSVGIRKIARFVEASPAGVLRWIRKEHAAVQARLAEQGAIAPSGEPDSIEMDEVYTIIQKNSIGR